MRTDPPTSCGKLGIRLVHSTPHRPQGRGKIERFFRTVRDQFLVEVADTTATDLADKQLTPAAALEGTELSSATTGEAVTCSTSAAVR